MDLQPSPFFLPWNDTNGIESHTEKAHYKIEPHKKLDGYQRTGNQQANQMVLIPKKTSRGRGNPCLFRPSKVDGIHPKIFVDHIS